MESIIIGEAKMLRWFLFKQLREAQAVDKLPPTQGAWIEHNMRRVHGQVNIWQQDMVLNLTCLDPLTWGWIYLNQNLVSVRYQCCSSSVENVINQSVREGSRAEGTVWYVPNYANAVEKATHCPNITQPMIGEDRDD